MLDAVRALLKTLAIDRLSRPSEQREGFRLKHPRLTYVSRSAAGCGHNAAGSLNLRQSEITDHDLGVFIHAVVE